MNKTMKLNLVLILTACINLYSCSAFSGGSSDGNGYGNGSGNGYGNGSGNGYGNGNGISDQDLALGGNIQEYADGNIPLASEGGLFQDIFFNYDSSTIRPDQVESIRRNAEILAQDPTLNVVVEGHCDSRGTSEYNLALGEERAKSVATMLVSFGADSNKVSTVSYGEEIPLANGENDYDFSQNRRAHFALSR